MFLAKDLEQSPEAFNFKFLNPSLRLDLPGQRFAIVQHDGTTKDLYSLNLATKLILLLSQTFFFFGLTIAAVVLCFSLHDCSPLPMSELISIPPEELRLKMFHPGNFFL